MGRDTVNKDANNKQSRKYYAAHKEEINKRRRQLYAERKKLSQAKNIASNQATGSGSGQPIISSNVSISVNRLCLQEAIEPGSSVRVTPHIGNCVPSIQLSNGEASTQVMFGIHIDDRFIRNVIRSLKRKEQHSLDLGGYIRSVLSPSDDRTLVLPKVPPCRHCGAYKFYKEAERFCCSRGEISIADAVLPPYIVDLITGSDSMAREFQNMIRTYNNHFAFTSIGMKCDEAYEHRNRGIYTVKVQGQVHHYLNDLLPHQGSNKLQGIQFYFYDPDHQVQNRLSSLPRLDPTIVQNLVQIMIDFNPYTHFLKQASDLQNLDEYDIVIRCDPGLDQRVYNTPKSNEVAGIWLENDSSAELNKDIWDVRVYGKSGHSHSVHYYYGCYDPLQYVLMFPKGEPGWHGNIPRVGHSMKRRKRGLHNTTVRDLGNFEDLLTIEEEGKYGNCAD